MGATNSANTFQALRVCRAERGRRRQIRVLHAKGDIRLPKTRHACQKRELQQGNSIHRTSIRRTCVSSPVEQARRDDRLKVEIEYEARGLSQLKEVYSSRVHCGRERLHLSLRPAIKGEAVWCVSHQRGFANLFLLRAEI